MIDWRPAARPLPPGSFDPSGGARAFGTAGLIAAMAPRTGALRLARYWARCRRPLEALALIEAAGRHDPAMPLRLRLLAELRLYSPLLAAVGRGRVPAGLHGALGLARLAIGDPDGAVPLLVEAVRDRSGWGAWLRAAAALAIIAPDRAEIMFGARTRAGRREEPLTALLLAHLAERSGDFNRALGLLTRAEAQPRPAEVDLLRAAVLVRRGDRAGAHRSFDRALARFGLPGFCAQPPMRDGGPLVTVIVAAYDAAETIEAALRSLTGQSWRAVDIIVIDDASTDETVAKVAALADADPRIRLLRQTANAGAYAARNRGLAAAAGEYVTVHDADDVAHPQRIERQLTPLLAEPGLVGSTARWLRREAPYRFHDRQLLPLLRLHVGSLLIRRAFLEHAVNGFEPVRYGADGDLLTRVEAAAGAGRIASLALPLTLSGLHPGSAVHDPDSGYGERGYSIARQRYHEASVLRCVSALSGQPLTTLFDCLERTLPL
ncbi:MAG: glycosyltransferase family 2 protein [Alphaproteobacteria bacterium]|nr:glycosyltransferase family 2 protein [Alphaproteobacteria bacterium]